MNIRFIHDLEKKIFVNDAGTSVKTIPEIAYGMKPVWEWQFINSAGEAWDFSQVVSWKAVIDTDHLHATEPMCRTLSGITVVDDIVYVPLDALTTTYRDKTDGKDFTKGFFDLTGYDAAGEKIFYFKCAVNCLYVLDPEEGVDPLDPPENYISPVQVEAIAQGVVDAALEAYTPPPGGEGPTGPAPQFEFSATGIAGTWHATWVPGDLYLRVSTDEGVTWQGPIPLGTAQATFPMVAAWSDEITYATGALMAFGTPVGLYQAKEPVGYDQSPATHPAKWQQIAGPGADGASSTWILGTGVPAAELGNDNDQYLDELYNHYRKADGAWTQVGNIKGANGAGINNRGAWAADAAYSVGDGVTSNGSVWCCKVPHSGQEPPATPEGVSLYWDLFLARGTTGLPGAAGTVQIVAINMLAPTADPYASEGSGSTAARRLYTLNIPRGSTGPAGSLRIEMGLPLEPEEDPVLEELPGSTPHNRAYRLQVPMGPQGERGSGMYVNATGTLAERVQYDSAAAGYAYLATDILTDDLDHHYQAMYFKQSDSVGDWSDAIRLYMGQQGIPGETGGPGPAGPPGENAAVKPDQEFIADDLFEGTLIVEGTDPIAQVEVNDVSGHGHALSLAGGDSGIAITTRRDTGQTLVAFGPSVDLTYGGRIRFAQGLSGLSLYQMWLDAGHTGTQTDYINWLKETATRIAITADDLVDVGDGDLGVTTETDGVVIAVIDEAGVQYLLADTEVSYAGTVCTVNLQRLLTLKLIETIPDSWQLILAGGKGEKGEPGDQPELSSSPAVALAATAAAGVSTVAARADHVHPTTGLVTPGQLANFIPVTFRGAANGVASLGANGKVPSSQLPEMSGSGGLSITRLRLARPSFDDATHLVVEAAVWPDFSDVARVIDTAAVAADRAKVLGFTGSVFVACPVDGFGGAFSRQTILIDLAGLVTVPSFIRYKWVAAGGDSDWYATYFPSTGEAYVAPPASTGGSGETPTPADTGQLQVTITGSEDGKWSINGGSTWYDSGQTLNLNTGIFTVMFKAVEGYTTPAAQSVTIVKDQKTTVEVEYFAVVLPDETQGVLKVITSGTDAARWSVDGGTTWYQSGYSLLLDAGSYTITYMAVDGFNKPSDESATVAVLEITTVNSEYTEIQYTADPADYGMTWDNGTEPTLSEGNKVIYVTPTGAGSKSGADWANAKAGVYAAMLAAADGDVLYLQAGEYTNHLSPIENKSVRISGGFDAVNGTWTARDGWVNKTIINASSNATVPFVKAATGKTINVDGLCFGGFTAGVVTNNGGSGSVKNCVFDGTGGTASSFGADNCLLSEGDGNIIGNAADCVFVNVDRSGGSVVSGNATDCIFLNCSVRNGGSVVSGNATDCIFLNCSSSSNSSIYSGYYNCIVSGDATDCTFTNCNSTNYNYDFNIIRKFQSYIVFGDATDCTFTNCSSKSAYVEINKSTSSSYHSYIVYRYATNCTFTNCSSSSNRLGTSYSIYIVYLGATNCTFIRCVANRLCVSGDYTRITNCVVFDCDIDTIDFGAGTNNAASAYIDANTLVLGTDNTLAKFASLGTVEAIGYSAALNDTPAADFGDFRPQAGSLLIGAGVAVSGITDDIDGNTRPDPPTIGAYEYVEETP